MDIVSAHNFFFGKILENQSFLMILKSNSLPKILMKKFIIFVSLPTKLETLLFVIDCLKINKHPSHFNLSEAINLSKMIKPKKTILTNLHSDLDYNYLIKKLPKNIIPAYDGMSFYI